MSSNTFRRSFAAVAGFAALWICANVHAVQVRAWLDRTTMQLGETVTLNVEVSDDASAAQPDFGALQQDFNLLGTQSSTSMNIVNGQTSSKLLWAVGLEPKHAGTIAIPALGVAGLQTQPLSLVVQPGNGGGASGRAGDEVFLDVAVEPKAPYVQQQVRVTVKLFYALNLTDGNLEDPHGDGIAARKLGQDTSYTAEVEGRRYKVLERHYALSAEKSGTLTLAPIGFRGHALNPADLNSFFNRGRAITAQAPATTLAVRARPANSGTDAWLPAQSLDLTAEGVDASTQAHVGEPLTLTLRLKAQGLGFEQLPELKLPQIDGADVYPDKESTQNRDDGAWQFGERERKFAIVPNRPGTLTIPALGLSWWDTAHDRAASADLPARTLQVAAVAGAGGQAAQNAASTQNGGGAAGAATAVQSALPVAATSPADAQTWRWLALGALALWVATLAAGFVWWRRQRGPQPMPAHGERGSTPAPDAASIRAARKAFADACARADTQASARALLAWARAEGSTARTLGELAPTLGDACQRDALRGLERARYAGADAASVPTAQLAAAFDKGLSLTQAMVAANEGASLPPLYPFVVRKDPASGAS